MANSHHRGTENTEVAQRSSKTFTSPFTVRYHFGRKPQPQKEQPNEFLRLLSTRGPAYDSEPPNFAVGPGCAQTNHQSTRLDLRSRHDQSEGRRGRRGRSP